VNLREAKAQIERDHPELTGTAKLQAIKELREQAAVNEAAAPTQNPGPKPASVGETWALFALVFVGMRLIAWPAWGSPVAGPLWYDVLYVVLLIASLTAIAGAYRRR
jgi:hypothetical protein